MFIFIFIITFRLYFIGIINLSSGRYIIVTVILIYRFIGGAGVLIIINPLLLKL